MRLVAITSKTFDRVQPTQATIDADPVLRRLIGDTPLPATVLDATEDGHPFPVIVEFDDGTLYAFEQSQVEAAEE